MEGFRVRGLWFGFLEGKKAGWFAESRTLMCLSVLKVQEYFHKKLGSRRDFATAMIELYRLAASQHSHRFKAPLPLPGRLLSGHRQDVFRTSDGQPNGGSAG